MRQARVRAPELADWALSRGTSALTTPQIAELLDVPEAHVSARLAAPRARGEWVTPARGWWVPVAPEWRTWGAPPGIELVDGLAAYLDLPYYVGWLSAAALYGASHQAPQVFQVAVSRQVRDRQVGRTRFEFHRVANLLSRLTTTRPTRSGSVRVATAELTAFDLADRVTGSGGLNNVATVLADLAEDPGLDPVRLVQMAEQFPSATVRRLGWLLESVGAHGLGKMQAVATHGPATPARLDPSRDLVGPVNRRWQVRVNAQVDGDL